MGMGCLRLVAAWLILPQRAGRHRGEGKQICLGTGYALRTGCIPSFAGEHWWRWGGVGAGCPWEEGVGLSPAPQKSVLWFSDHLQPPRGEPQLLSMPQPPAPLCPVSLHARASSCAKPSDPTTPFSKIAVTRAYKRQVIHHVWSYSIPARH